MLGYLTSCYFWLALALLGFLLLWLLWGGREHEVIGLKPLEIGYRSPSAQPTPSVEPTPSASLAPFAPPVCPAEPRRGPTIRLLPTPPKKPQSKGEAACKKALEEIFGVPFIKARPNWLRNTETGYALELDCYNEDLRIAAEYNGIQHYQWPNFTGQSQAEFVQQVRRDQFKREKCDEVGVYLITVPYNVPHEAIKDFIIQQLPQSDRSLGY